jgi:N-acetyldiaminopimelate deacetylase
VKNINLFEIRQQLHQIPEIAFQEFKTKELLLSYLTDLPGITIHQFKTNTGILIEYSKGKGEYQLFRADMDGLPIQEATGCEFSSQHAGMMHACGHDVHMAILLGLIFWVVETKPQQNLLFLFQPAEEGQGGAESIISEGLLQKYQIKSAFALHVNGNLPLNTISAKAGIFFAIPQEFDVEFIGKSAHAAFPANGKDALRAGVEFYQQMHNSIQKQFGSEQVIFNIGELHSGTVRNVIPDKCVLKGTHRTLTKATRDLINAEIKTLATAIAKQYKLKFKFTPLCTYDPVVNDGHLYEQLKQACNALAIDFRESKTYMTGEDFGFFTSLYPGLLFWLGAGENEHNLHSDCFLPDANCIPTGINLLYSFAITV